MADAKEAVQKAVAKPAAAVKEEAKKTVSRFESKKAEVQKAVQKPVAEARTLPWALALLSCLQTGVKNHVGGPTAESPVIMLHPLISCSS